LRDDARPGPFGETLRIKTGSLDQPFIEVPVFGIVAARIKMEPLPRGQGFEFVDDPDNFERGPAVCWNPAALGIASSIGRASYQAGSASASPSPAH